MNGQPPVKKEGSVISNPLIAAPQDSTKAYSGISLAESAADLKSAIETGDWASVAMGAVGTALDALSMAMDPFGAILAAGVGWLMEHVGPLKEALNGLTGNADEIAAQSETWKNVATELGSIGEDFAGMSTTDTASWTGVAADAYRQRAKDTVALLDAAKKGCEGASSGVKTAGEVVAAVRALVRDIIAELVGHMISWALQVLFTLGIGLTWVVPQVVAAVAKTASKIADLVKRLVQALKALIPLLKRAGDLFGDAAKALRNIKPGKAAPPTKHPDINGNPKNLDGPKGGKGGGEGGGGKPPEGTGAKPPPANPGKGDDGGSTHTSGASGSPSGNGSGGGSHSPTPTPDPPKTPDATPTPTPAPNPKPDTGSTSASGAGKGPSGNPPNPHKPDAPRDRGVGADNRVCETDPIDVATGEMVLMQSDVTFPGPLELELTRTHVSSYRAGGLFGASWASTVDQRLELDAEHACYFSPDGMILVYPRPEPGRPVLPLEGPRWHLEVDHDGTYTLVDPAERRSLVFAPVPGTDIVPLRAIERAGSRIEIDHDPSGTPVAWRHSDGYRVNLRVDRGRVHRIDVVDPAGELTVQVATFGYDERGCLTSVVNSSGKPMVFDYDIDGRITGWQDRTGAWYRYIYDAEGRCVRTVGDRGFLDGAFAYEDGVTRYTDSLGHTKTFELNDLNQVVRETDQLGNATAFVYDRYDRLLSRTDPLGRTTAYSYDGAGRLSAVTRPDRSTVDVNADPDVPLAISVTDGERSWSREYAEGAPEGQYGVAEDFRYESLRDEDEPAGNEQRDLFGRPRARTDAFGGQVRFEWTVEGLRAARVGRTGERELWRYDAEGNEIEHVTSAGAVERAEFGPFGLKTASVDAAGARTTYAYDSELRPISVTNPNGLTWHYRYDPAGRLVEERDFDGRVLRFSYDAAGRLVRSVNGAGEATDYQYDVLGNVVERHTPAGIISYAYDPVGNLVRASTSDTVLEYERDAAGRALRETVDGRSVQSAYDEQGRLVSRRTPSGVDSVWTYDQAGNPGSLAFAGHSLEFGHDAAGREVRRTIDGTVVLTQTYDVADRLTGQAVATPLGTVRQRRFDLRPDGALVAVTDSATGTTHYRRDPAGRLVEVAAPDHREHYRYDATGRITESVVDGSWPVDAESGARGYTAGTLGGAGIVGYTHDAQGRLVARHVVDPAAGARSWTYHWDPLDRMTGVTTPDGTRWQYRYDPLGRRIAKLRLNADGTVAERVDFAWAGTVLVEQVHTDAAGRREVLTWAHHPDDDRPVAQAGPVFHAVVTDRIGTPVDLVDPAAARIEQVRTALWGRALPGAPTPLRFPGQYADPETGLHYNVHRYYDPATGRYLSKDPLGLAPAPDPAAYVPDPLRQADPLGLMFQSPCGGSGSGSRGPQQTPGGGFDPGRSAPVKPGLSDVNPSSGRTTQQGGGWYGGGHYGKGDSAGHVGNYTKPGHLTDVEDLNQANKIKDHHDPATGETWSGNDLSQDLVDHLEANGMPGDHGWVKGHLENDNLGGSGEAHNLTPLTDKANSAHKNHVESSIKELVNRVNGDVFKKNGIDHIGVDYEVKTSPNVKFPNSPNSFEHSIRDYVEINAKYTGVDQNVLDTMRRNGMQPLAELPPPGTRMDTITGQFSAPDGHGGFVPWRKGNRGHDFSGQGLT